MVGIPPNWVLIPLSSRSAHLWMESNSTITSYSFFVIITSVSKTRVFDQGVFRNKSWKHRSPHCRRSREAEHKIEIHPTVRSLVSSPWLRAAIFFIAHSTIKSMSFPSLFVYTFPLNILFKVKIVLRIIIAKINDHSKKAHEDKEK